MPNSPMSFYNWEDIPGETSAAKYLNYVAVINQFNKEKEMPKKNNESLKAKEGFLFGADPELFITDETGRHVSAEGLIPGTKESPHKVDKGAVQVDGMAAEFNIEPASSFDEFDDNIVTVMKQLKTFLPKGYNFSIIPSVDFDEEVFANAPDKAKELGCKPDNNAWTGGFNPTPRLTSRPRLRCAGGHIHIGWTEGADVTDIQHTMNCRDMVKQLDWFLGGWSIKQDADATRRMLYGKAGAYRPKSYGVEYRVLSNFWITSKENRLVVWNRVQRAINDMANKFLPDRLGMHFQEELIRAINTSKPSSLLMSDVPYPIVYDSPMGL